MKRMAMTSSSSLTFSATLCLAVRLFTVSFSPSGCDTGTSRVAKLKVFVCFCSDTINPIAPISRFTDSMMPTTSSSLSSGTLDNRQT